MKFEMEASDSYGTLILPDGTKYLLSPGKEGRLIVNSENSGQCLLIKPMGAGTITIQQY